MDGAKKYGWEEVVTSSAGWILGREEMGRILRAWMGWLPQWRTDNEEPLKITAFDY